ncbi:Ovostatin-like protein [Armadillidium nasatum]|uniref:Ovostatin-like protein n=1 Tax=Armadillidium nasatum TaxID=96803 RepID=A0A5N5T1D6_9CRUS|nr:Ovostatin-like protein [Armadillidium nasatum]
MKTISYNFGFYDYDLEEVVVLIQQTNIVVPQGTKNICQNIYLPPNEEWEAEFTIVGSLEGEAVNYTKPVAITSEIYQTFIQTDKYLYKPSQLVQFRILTVFGPFLKVSLDAYEEIWISSPSGGEYEINVQTSSGKLYNRIFKVEEYVLPRFEVKINPPNYILGSTEIITFEVCADYTFGEPVNGKASISVDNNMWDYNVVVTRKDEISGCISFSINASELNINGFDDDDDDKDKNDFFYYGYKVYSLTANAHVIEDGTGIFLEADPIDVKIFRTALGFKDISVQKLYKPELPYIGKISAPNYPKIKSGNNTFDYDVIMYKSGINIRLKEYHSPSNSSLIIALPNEELECETTAESIDFVLPITFAATQSSASVTVQIVSRGQIVFKKTFDQIFTEGPFLSIDESLFIEPVQDSSTQNLIRGFVDKSVELLTPRKLLLTVKRLLQLAQRSSVGSYDFRQVDDYRYCENQQTDKPPTNYTDTTIPTDATPPTTEPTASPSSSPERRKKRAVLPSRDGSDSLRRSERSIIIGPWWPPFYNNYDDVDALYMINGSYEKVLTVPDTVTEWVGSAICVHPSKGVGISGTATITIYKEFFIDLSLPSSVKRGEIFPAKISIFNYLNESLPITIILSSPDNKFDILEDSGNMTGSGMRNACVPLQDKIVLSIRIRAKDVGDVNISVEAIVQANAVSNCGSGIVQQQTDSLIKPIRVDFEGFLKEETRFKYLCTNGSVSETWNIAAPGSIVPDSARGFVAVVGDLMGPTLDNLGDLVKMPYGCGEQNMINFAPNIFVMQYLDSTDQNTEVIAAKAIGFMKAGYERELNYRHSDGSFSAFGEREGSNETGSTWLTAFVLKCFGQASAYISIDQKDLNLTLEWLKSQQNVNGCFESVGQLFNKAMQGGVDSGSPSMLTSYVVISMVEAGEWNNSTVISEALSCINATLTTTNPYSLAIKAYALALAKSLYTQAVLDQLLSLSTSSANGLYWEIPSEYVIALQALAAYEKTVSQGPVDLTVLVTMGTVSKSFSINEQNKLLQQSVALPTVPISITFDVSGQGCALLQAVLRYSVPNGEINECLQFKCDNINGTRCSMQHEKNKRLYLIPSSR